MTDKNQTENNEKDKSHKAEILLGRTAIPDTPSWWTSVRKYKYSCYLMIDGEPIEFCDFLTGRLINREIVGRLNYTFEELSENHAESFACALKDYGISNYVIVNGERISEIDKKRIATEPLFHEDIDAFKKTLEAKMKGGNKLK